MSFLILSIFAIGGILTGLNFVIPYSYSEYVAVAILACLDSVFGALRANLENKFGIKMFVSGFFANAIISMFLVYLGNKLNVDMYIAAIVVFGGRLLNNFSAIRRLIAQKIEKMRKKDEISKEIENKI